MSRRFLTIALIVGMAPFVTGCSSMSNTSKDALAGGGIGAVSGAIIDRATGGKGGTGAIAGGIIGTAIGGAIGNEKDQKEKAVLQAQAQNAEARAAAGATQVGIFDVIQLAKEGRSDDLIINQIRTTNSTYTLSTEDVRNLSANGVSDRVIMEMQSRRPETVPRTRYVAAPQPVFVQPAPVYVYGPPPPVGVGVIFRR